MTLLFTLAGFLLIWIAVDIGRKEDSKVSIFSWEFLFQAILISIGTAIVAATKIPNCE